MLSNLCFHILLLYLWCFPFYNDIACFLPYDCNLCLNIFTGHRFLGWQFFSAQHLKHSMLHLSSLPGFWREVHCHLNFFFSVYSRCYVSLAAMKFHSLSYIFRSLIIMWIYLDLSCLGFAYRFGSIGLFMPFDVVTCPVLTVLLYPNTK